MDLQRPWPLMLIRDRDVETSISITRLGFGPRGLEVLCTGFRFGAQGSGSIEAKHVSRIEESVVIVHVGSKALKP